MSKVEFCGKAAFQFALDAFHRKAVRARKIVRGEQTLEREGGGERAIIEMEMCAGALS